jgi:putative MATE family efflux protein
MEDTTAGTAEVGTLLEERISVEDPGLEGLQQENIRQLHSGPILRLLTQYAIPAMIASTAISLYNIIDRIFIGHGVGAMAIAGLALTLPLMNMGVAFGVLVGMGGAALISIRMGQRKQHEAEQILGNTLLLNLALGIAYSVVCSILLDPMLRLTGASPETLPYARQFMQIILIGNVFTHLYFGMNFAMRSSGYPRGAMINVLQTVAINCLLAPLFIFVFHWGIRGAALATVLAQTTGALFFFFHFLRRDSTVRFYARNLRPSREIIVGIFSIGMSSFALMLCVSMTALLFNVRIVRYGGDYAVGAFGIANTLVMFFVMVSVGMTQGMQPIVGYNYGAGQFQRVKAVFAYTIVGTTAVMFAGFLLAELFPRAVASAFTSDAELIKQTVRGLRLIVLMFMLDGFQMTTSIFFQAIGKAKFSLLLTLSRQLIFLVPFLIVLPWFLGLNGVWLGEPAADLTAFLTTLFVLKRHFRRILPA